MAQLKTNLKTIWNGSTDGKGSIKMNNVETPIAIDEAMGGSGEGANPKELLVSSAAACYTMTLVSILKARKLPTVKFTMNSESTMSEEDGLIITHYPQITLSAEVTEKQIAAANRAFAAADKACAVGNMLKEANAQIDISGKLVAESGEEIK